MRETPGGDNGASGSCLTIFAIVLCVLFFPIAVFAIVNIIPEYQRAVIFRLGRIKVSHIERLRVISLLRAKKL